jgi:predicted RNase H-like nuclease (RuvC/YqgF family)
MKELKWSDEDIKDIRDALIEYGRINEELNAKIIAMDAYVKNGDAKLRTAQRYISQLETLNSQLLTMNTELDIINQQLQTPNLN